MAKNNDTIPDNCDKILFAEDVVSHILYLCLQVRYQPKVATPYREFIYEACDETIREALDDIYKRVVAYNILFNVEYRTPNLCQFHMFAMKFLKKYFNSGFAPRHLLYYSVHLSMAAARMVDSIGLQNAGNLAVKYVLKGFRGCDMFTGGWDVLHMVASRYCSRKDFMDNLTPDIEIMAPPNAEEGEVSDEDDTDEDTAEVTNVLEDENCASSLEKSRESVNNEVKVCLDDLKDILEKEQQLNIIQSTSTSTDSDYSKRSPKRDYKGIELSRPDFKLSNFSPEVFVSSESEEAGNLTKLLESELNIVKKNRDSL